MSWAIGYDSRWKRDIGYGVPAYCDQPGCNEKIDRGLDHVCGSNYYGEPHGCGLYFCENHHQGNHRTCAMCQVGLDWFQAKADHPEWIVHKLTDSSWKQWRFENEGEVKRMRIRLDQYMEST